MILDVVQSLRTPPASSPGPRPIPAGGSCAGHSRQARGQDRLHAADDVMRLYLEQDRLAQRVGERLYRDGVDERDAVLGVIKKRGRDGLAPPYALHDVGQRGQVSCGALNDLERLASGHLGAAEAAKGEPFVRGPYDCAATKTQRGM